MSYANSIPVLATRLRAGDGLFQPTPSGGRIITLREIKPVEIPYQGRRRSAVEIIGEELFYDEKSGAQKRSVRILSTEQMLWNVER